MSSLAHDDVVDKENVTRDLTQAVDGLQKSTENRGRVVNALRGNKREEDEARQVIAMAAKQRDRLSSELALAECRIKGNRGDSKVDPHDQSTLLSLRLKLIAKENQMHVGSERVAALAQQNASLEESIREMDALLTLFRAEVASLEKARRDAHCCQRQISLLREQDTLAHRQAHVCSANTDVTRQIELLTAKLTSAQAAVERCQRSLQTMPAAEEKLRLVVEERLGKIVRLKPSKSRSRQDGAASESVTPRADDECDHQKLQEALLDEQELEMRRKLVSLKELLLSVIDPSAAQPPGPPSDADSFSVWQDSGAEGDAAADDISEAASVASARPLGEIQGCTVVPTTPLSAKEPDSASGTRAVDLVHHSVLTKQLASVTVDRGLAEISVKQLLAKQQELLDDVERRRLEVEALQSDLADAAARCEAALATKAAVEAELRLAERQRSEAVVILSANPASRGKDLVPLCSRSVQERAKLEARLSELGALLEEAQSRRSILEQSSMSTAAELLAANESVSALEHSLAEARANQAALCQELQAATVGQTAAQNHARRLHDQVLHLEEEKSEAENELARLRPALDDFKGQMQMLMSAMSATNEQLQDSIRERDEAKLAYDKTVQCSKATAGALMRERDELQRQREALAAQVAALEGRLQHEAGALAVELQIAREQLAAAEASHARDGAAVDEQLEEARQHALSLEEEHSAMADELHNAASMKVAALLKVSDLEAELAEKEHTISDLLTDLDVARRTGTPRGEGAKEVCVRAFQKIRDMRQELSTLTDAIEERDRQLAAQQPEAERLRRAAADAAAALQAAEERSRQAAAENDARWVELERQHATLARQHNALQADHAAAEDDLLIARRALVAHEAAVVAAAVARDELQATLAAAEGEVAALNARLGALESSVLDAWGREQAAKAAADEAVALGDRDREELSTRLFAMESKVTDAEAREARLEAEAAEAEAREADVAGKMRAKVQELVTLRLAEHQRALELAGQLAAEQAAHAAAVQRLEGDKSALASVEQQLAAAQQALDALAASEQTAADDAAGLRALLDALNRDLDAVRALNLEQCADLTALRASEQRLAAELGDARAASEDAAAALAAEAAARAESDAALEGVRAQIAALESELVAARGEAAGAAAARDDAVLRAADLQREVAGLRAELERSAAAAAEAAVGESHREELNKRLYALEALITEAEAREAAMEARADAAEEREADVAAQMRAKVKELVTLRLTEHKRALELADQLAAEQAAHSEALQQLGELQESVLESQAAKRAALEEAIALKNQLDERDDTCESLIELNRARDARVEELTLGEQQLRSQLTDAQLVAETRATELSALQAVAAALDADRHGALEQLTSEVTALEGELSGARLESQRLQRELSEAVASRESEGERAADLDRQLRAEQGKRQEAAAALEALRDELAALVPEVSALRGKCRGQEEALAESETAREGLNERLYTLEAAVTEAEAREDALAAKAAEAEAREAEVSAKMREKVKELVTLRLAEHQRALEVAGQLAAEQAAHSEALQQLEVVGGERLTAQAAVRSAEEEAAALKSQLEARDDALGSLTERNQTQAARIQELTHGEERLLAQLADATLVAASRETELSAMKTAAVAAEAERHAALDRLNSELASLGRELLDAKTEAQRLQRELSEAAAAREAAAAASEAAAARAAEQDQQLREERRQRQQAAAVAEALRGELAVIAPELAALRERFQGQEAALADSETAREGLNERLYTLEAAVTEAEAREDSLATQAAEAEAREADLAGTMRSKVQQLVTLRLEEHQRALELADQLAAEQAAHSEALQQLAPLQEKLLAAQELHRRAASQSDALEAEVARLHVASESGAEAALEQAAHIATLEASKRRLAADLDDAHARLQQREAALAELTASAAEAAASAATAADGLQRQIAALEGELSEARGELQRVEAERVEAAARAAELAGVVEELRLRDEERQARLAALEHVQVELAASVAALAAAREQGAAQQAALAEGESVREALNERLYALEAAVTEAEAREDALAAQAAAQEKEAADKLRSKVQELVTLRLTEHKRALALEERLAAELGAAAAVAQQLRDAEALLAAADAALAAEALERAALAAQVAAGESARSALEAERAAAAAAAQQVERLRCEHAELVAALTAERDEARGAHSAEVAAHARTEAELKSERSVRAAAEASELAARERHAAAVAASAAEAGAAAAAAERQLSEMRAACAAAEDRLAAEQVTLAEVSASLVDIRAALADVTRLLDAEQAARRLAEAERELTKGDAAKLQTALKQQDQRLAELLRANISLKTALESAAAQTAEQGAAFEAAVTEADALRSAVALAAAQRDAAAAAEAAAIQRADQLQASADGASAEAAALKAELSAANAARAAARVDAERAAAAARTLTAQLAATADAAGADRAALEQRLDQARRQQDALKWHLAAQLKAGGDAPPARDAGSAAAVDAALAAALKRAAAAARDVAVLEGALRTARDPTADPVLLDSLPLSGEAETLLFSGCVEEALLAERTAFEDVNVPGLKRGAPAAAVTLAARLQAAMLRLASADQEVALLQVEQLTHAVAAARRDAAGKGVMIESLELELDELRAQVRVMRDAADEAHLLHEDELALQKRKMQSAAFGGLALLAAFVYVCNHRF